MWIAIRLVLALVGFLIRRIRRGPAGKVNGHFEGLPYFADVDRSKRGITGFTLSTARRSPTWVRLHAESALDRWFKRIGVANESQTGDESFDDEVYVASDHPHVATILRETPELRAAIRDAFVRGYRRVQFDGHSVSIERRSSEPPGDNDLRVLARIHAASAAFEDEMPSRFADPFLWRALAVEGLIWSLFGYAVGGLLEFMIDREDLHLHGGEVVKLGLLVAAAAYVLLGAVIVLWMRGSSRGHRVIVESAVVLLLGLPVASIQAVADTNRALDDAPAVTITRVVERCEVREHRGRRGRRSYSYHLRLEAAREPGHTELPDEIEVTSALCRASSEGASIEFTVGPGRWGLAWYRRIRVGDEVWTAPL